jgi:hypothetical protein
VASSSGGDNLHSSRQIEKDLLRNKVEKQLQYLLSFLSFYLAVLFFSSELNIQKHYIDEPMLAKLECSLPAYVEIGNLE